MAWRVVHAYLSFIDDHDEWTGTSVTFDLTAGAGGTTVNFTHEGLTASGSACFTECTVAGPSTSPPAWRS